MSFPGEGELGRWLAWIAAFILLAGAACSSGHRSARARSATSTTASGRPRSLVALTQSGDLLLVDVRTGRSQRLAPRPGSVASVKPDVSVTPDHRWAYLGAGTGANDISCGGGVYKVPLAGGVPVLVMEHASVPVVSPDGSTLAFVVGDDFSDCGIGLMNLASGTVRELRFPEQPPPPTTAPLIGKPGLPPCNSITSPKVFPELALNPSMAWAPDSRRLALVGQGNGFRAIRMVDVSVAKDLNDAAVIGPTDPGKTTGWDRPVWRGPSSLWVFESDQLACERTPQRFDIQTRLLEVDTATGQTRLISSFRMPLAPANAVQARQDPTPSRYAVDAKGLYLVWASTTGAAYDERDGKPHLLYSPPSNERHEIDPVVAVAW